MCRQVDARAYMHLEKIPRMDRSGDQNRVFASLQYALRTLMGEAVVAHSTVLGGGDPEQKMVNCEATPRG